MKKLTHCVLLLTEYHFQVIPSDNWYLLHILQFYVHGFSLVFFEQYVAHTIVKIRIEYSAAKPPAADRTFVNGS